MTKKRLAILTAGVLVAILALLDASAQCQAPEEGGQLALSRIGTDAVIQWTLPIDAQASELVKGDLRTGRVNVIGVGESCLGTDLTGAYTDNVNPPSSSGFWYLVRATNDCGKGPWGLSQESGLSAPRVTECGCHPDFAAAERYATNNYTVSDRRTCLEWEKKSGDAAVVLHDVNSVPTFFGIMVNQPTPGLLMQINTERFAGHGDWRLPRSSGPLDQPTGQPPELESLLLVPCPDPMNHVPCIDPVFGLFPPNAAFCDPADCSDPLAPVYWSASSQSPRTNLAWGVNFTAGTWNAAGYKHDQHWYFRVVRGVLYGE